MTDENAASDLARVADSVDRLTRLLTLALLDGKTKVEQMMLLANAGWQAREIAALLGGTPNSVSVALHAERRRLNIAAPKSSKKPAKKKAVKKPAKRTTR
jgi:hypothetical protein